MNGAPHDLWNAPGAILYNGNLLLFTRNSYNCSITYEQITNICGYIDVDVNGFKGPNVLGKDIFIIYITKYGIKPDGYKYIWSTCKASESGSTCATEYLSQ